MGWNFYNKLPGEVAQSDKKWGLSDTQPIGFSTRCTLLLVEVTKPNSQAKLLRHIKITKTKTKAIFRRQKSKGVQ